jgi:hypothetical protein
MSSCWQPTSRSSECCGARVSCMGCQQHPASARRYTSQCVTLQPTEKQNLFRRRSSLEGIARASLGIEAILQREGLTPSDAAVGAVPAIKFLPFP